VKLGCLTSRILLSKPSNSINISVCTHGGLWFQLQQYLIQKVANSYKETKNIYIV